MGLLLPIILVTGLTSPALSKGAVVTFVRLSLLLTNNILTKPTPNKRKKMNIVNTQTSPSMVARTAEGKVDVNAYLNLEGTIEQDGLTIAVKTIGARTRYGHLDLEVAPVAGHGRRWVERKNIALTVDPAASPF
jgi:hypothetical protein